MADERDKKGGGAAVADRPAAPDDFDKTVVRPAEEREESTPARPQYTPPYVIIVEGPRTGARFPLGDGANIIGRAQQNAVRLEDQSVSRQHAEINGGESGWTVKDLGSKNGTVVNGQPIAEQVTIGHKDVVKTGIYQMRLILEPTSVEEEMTLPPELAMADRTVFVAAPPESMTAKLEKGEVPEEPPAEKPAVPPPPPAAEEPGEAPAAPKRRLAVGRRQLVMLGVLGIVVIGVAAYFAQRFLFQQSAPPTELAEAPTEAAPKALPPQGEGAATPPPPPGGQPPTAEGTPPPAGTTPSTTAQPAPPKPPAPSPVQTVPVFLDFASSPMSAEVTFQGKELGRTPLRVNMELEPDKSYTANALFVMPEIRERYTQKVEFTVEKDATVVPILFRGPIGLIKVMDIPRDVDFYLEGNFAYDRFKEQSAKLQEVVLRKPIYIPYGNYHIELRRQRQLGESSQTFVKDIIFKRDVVIAEESPTYVLEVGEEDLKQFPVRIRTEPPNADVFIDGKKVGKTPYEGNFPLGEHKLVVRKEGYFEHAEELNVDINTPFAAQIKLKTSVAGAHINNARLAMNREMWQEAVNELAEALGSGPAPSEASLAKYLLGVCYLNLRDIQRAMGYFEQARESDEVRHKAMLGLVNGYAMLNEMNRALPLLVEVLLQAKDDETKREANDLFQKVSPFRSVIYVYSEPSGATVIVNDKPVAQKTPVILHDLPLGSYRIKVTKPGFQPTDLNLSLSVNEFNPVVVKLKPIPQ